VRDLVLPLPECPDELAQLGDPLADFKALVGICRCCKLPMEAIELLPVPRTIRVVGVDQPIFQVSLYQACSKRGAPVRSRREARGTRPDTHLHNLHARAVGRTAGSLLGRSPVLAVREKVVINL
jgi:hypothetical protein